MSLSSSSTLAEVRAAYDDNCDYDISDSAAKAKEFILACRILLNRVPEETQFGGGERIREAHARLQSSLDRAENWLRAKGEINGSSAVRVFSVEAFRT